MKPIVRWVLRIGGGFLVLVLLAAVAVFGFSERNLRAAYEVTPHDVPMPVADSAVLARGEHIASTWGCHDCHGADLGGQALLPGGPVGTLWAPNLTRGEGGAAATFTAADWDRAVRHGIGRDGRSLWVMPSMDYWGMADDDLAALVSFIATQPPVDRRAEPRGLGPVGRMMSLQAGESFLVASAVEDHGLPHPSRRPAVAATVEYGAYVGRICVGCHGADFAGGITAGPPGSPPSANITPASAGLGDWSEEDLFRAFRRGLRPDGSEIDADAMPWRVLGTMEDEEIRALWLWLQTLEPVENEY